MSQRSGGGSVSANFAQTWRLSSTPQHDSIRSFKFHPDAGNIVTDERGKSGYNFRFEQIPYLKISEIQKKLLVFADF